MLSVAITTRNRAKEVVAALEVPLQSGLVEQIVIADDASQDTDELKRVVEQAQRQTTKSIRLDLYNTREGPLGNKLRAVDVCTAKFAVLLDSDNAINHEYLNHMMDQIEIDAFDPWCIYAPESGRHPNLTFTDLSGITLTRHNICRYMDNPHLAMLLNDGNYVVPVRNFHTIVGFYQNYEAYAADVIYANYCWLREGGRIKIVPGAQYTHAIHPGSYWGSVQTQSLKVAADMLRRMEGWKND